MPLHSFRAQIVHVITDHVIFREMNPPQALQYIKEIMAEYRTEDYRAKVGEFYPFEEDALEYIIQNLEKRPPFNQQTLRKHRFSRSSVKQEEGILRGEIEIDMEFVKTMSRSEIDQELE